MRYKIKQQICIVLIIAAIFVLLEGTVYAHRMLIREIEPGHIQVFFDDGTVAKGAQVTLYDHASKELLQGTSDTDGYFKYDRNLAVARVVANDGMGHRATWRPGQEVGGDLPRRPVIMITASAFIFIAALSNYLKTRKKLSGKKNL